METGTGCHSNNAGGEVISCSFLKYFWFLNGTTLLPGGFGSRWNNIFKFLLFFLGPTPPLPPPRPFSLATFTAASHFTALSLWDFTTKISLRRTNCCHDNGRGAVCEREHKCDCVSNCEFLSDGCKHVCVQYGHVSGLFSFYFDVCLLVVVSVCISGCVRQTCSRVEYPCP